MYRIFMLSYSVLSGSSYMYKKLHMMSIAESHSSILYESVILIFLEK